MAVLGDIELKELKNSFELGTVSVGVAGMGESNLGVAMETILLPLPVNLIWHAGA